MAEPLDGGERARNGVRGLEQIRAVLLWGKDHVDELRQSVEMVRSLDVGARARATAESLLPAELEQVPRTYVVIADGRKVQGPTL